MENLGSYMMYVVEGIFVLLLLYAGVSSMLRYPHYSSKRALLSKDNWDYAQKAYGKYLLLFAGVQTVIGVFWRSLAELAMATLKSDNAGMAVVTCPIILFFILANILTEVKLRRY